MLPDAFIPLGQVPATAGRPRDATAARLADELARLRARVVFGCSWRRRLAEKPPYLTGGSLEDLETHGRKRLLPQLAHLPVGAISEQTSETGWPGWWSSNGRDRVEVRFPPGWVCRRA